MLRKELLSRYYGTEPARLSKAAGGRSASRSSVGLLTAEAERGRVMLSRAQMTLHDVQVTALSHITATATTTSNWH